MLSQKVIKKINEWLNTFSHGEQIVFNEDKTSISYYDECGDVIETIEI